MRPTRSTGGTSSAKASGAYSRSRMLLDNLRQCLPHVGHALFHFFDRRSRTAMFVFDERSNGIFLFLQKRQHFLDRRVTFAPGHVRALVLFSIFHMQVSDGLVVVPDELDGIEVGR